MTKWTDKEVEKILLTGIKTDEYGSPVSIDNFQNNALYVASKELEADIHSYGKVKRGRIESLIEVPSIGHSESAAEIFNEYAKDEYPYILNWIKNRDLSAKRLFDLLPRPQWEKTNIYNLLYRVIGIKEHLTVGIDLPGDSIVAIAAFRIGSCKEFSDKDVQNMNRLGRIISNTYHKINKKFLIEDEDNQSREYILASAFKLTVRQAQVLLGYWQGKNPDEIAKELKIAIGTFNVHRGEVYRRLKINSRLAAQAMATEALGPPKVLGKNA